MHTGTSESNLVGRSMAALVVLQPLLFAAGFVLERFALTPSSGHELMRPLVVALGLAAGFLLVAWAFTRNWPSAAFIASLGFLVLAFHPVAALVVAGIGAWWIGVGLIRRRRGKARPAMSATDAPSFLASIYAVALFALGAISAVPALLPPTLTERPTPQAIDSRATADIFLILLDGYPRGDTLAAEFGFDNGDFEAGLAEIGFEVATNARSNYNKTWLTVASMLAGAYVHDLPEVTDPPATLPAQARLAETLINSSPLLESLREVGYEIVSVTSPVPTTDVTANARVLQVPNLNSLEIALVTSALPSWLAPDAVLNFLASDARGYADAQLDLLTKVAAPQEAPRLVLAHLMPPHPPFVLDQELDYLSDCFPGCKVWETTVEETGLTEAEYAARVRTQVGALNERVLDTLTQVTTANPDAMVVVLSDHGARHYIDSADEHFRIFFAARAGESEVSFADDVSPVNVFRRLLSANGSAALEDLPYQAQLSDWFLPLELSRYP